MTRAEAAALGLAVRQRKAAHRAALLNAFVAAGHPLKRARHMAGVPERTATRYRTGAR